MVAASRANLSNSRPIVGSRNCRKWAFTKSIVASAIGVVLPWKMRETFELDDRNSDHNSRHTSCKEDTALMLGGLGISGSGSEHLGGEDFSV